MDYEGNRATSSRITHSGFDRAINSLRAFLVIAALANFTVTVRPLRLSVYMQPGLLRAVAERFAIRTSVVMRAGVPLLLTRVPQIAALVLTAVIGIGFVIGCLEDFFVTSPYSVFQTGRRHWVFPWQISVAILVAVQIAQLSSAGRMLAARARGDSSGMSEHRAWNR